MDLRLVVGNPVATKPSRSVVYPVSSPCYRKIKLVRFPFQIAVVAFIPPENPLQYSQIVVYTGLRGITCGDVVYQPVAGRVDKWNSLFRGNNQSDCWINHWYSWNGMGVIAKNRWFYVESIHSD